MYNRSTMINNETVKGMPDLRFQTYPKTGDYDPKLIVVTEVNDEFYTNVYLKVFFFIMMGGKIRWSIKKYVDNVPLDFFNKI